VHLKRVITINLLLILILLVSACGGEEPIQVNPEESAEPNADMVNPAAVYCVGLGYTIENVTRNEGVDTDCIFPDGSGCGQWDFLSGRCGQEYSFCELQGHTLGEGTNIGTCQFPDSSICDEFLFFSGVTFSPDSCSFCGLSSGFFRQSGADTPTLGGCPSSS